MQILSMSRFTLCLREYDLHVAEIPVEFQTTRPRPHGTLAETDVFQDEDKRQVQAYFLYCMVLRD